MKYVSKILSFWMIYVISHIDGFFGMLVKKLIKCEMRVLIVMDQKNGWTLLINSRFRTFLNSINILN